MRPVARGLLGLILGAAAVAVPARASLVLALDIPQLVWRADSVVVAEVLAVRSSWDARRERIDSEVEMRVLETWKGTPAAEGRLVVRHAGGSVDGIAMRVVGAPRFSAGERAVLFLRGPASSAAVVGMAQGKRTLRRETSTGRWIAEGGAGGAATVAPDATGRLRPASVDPARPLDELRAYVRTLVAPDP